MSDAKRKAIEYYDYLVKMNPNKNVVLKFFIRVFDGGNIEASCQPFLLEKPCEFSMAEYVMTSGFGANLKIENIQLYFDEKGESYEYAPYKGGRLKIDVRQAWAGYQTQSGYYECSYARNNLEFKLGGVHKLAFLSFYKLCLSYADMVSQCTSQIEIDYLKQCLHKDIKIEELNILNLKNEAEIAQLNSLLKTHQKLIARIEEIVSCDRSELNGDSNQ